MPIILKNTAEYDKSGQPSMTDATPPFSTLTRRNFLHIGAQAIVYTALGGLTACGPSQPLRIASEQWCGYQFMFLAQQEGWLPKSGLELRETGFASDSVAALKQGQVDGAALTLNEVLLLRDQGMPLSVVTVFDISAGADVVLAKPGISRLADLKGQRIGVEATSLGVVMLSKVLEAAGLQRSDVTVINMDEDHLAAWNSANMDAVLTYEPALSRLQKQQGLVSLYDSRKLPLVIVDVLVVRPEAAERHAEALRALIAGHFRALTQWRNNPIDTAYRLSARLGIKADEVKSVFKGLDLPDAAYNRKYLTAPAIELTQSVQAITRILTQEGLLKHPVNLDGLFVADYLPWDRP
jgi:NitT/TauT family transport system substrate-binding protein